MSSPLQAVRDGFHDLLGWKTDEELAAVEFCCTAWLTTYLPYVSEKAWGMLVGAPATGKSEIFHALAAHPRSLEKHRFTPNSFVSAYRPEDDPTKDPSFLAELAHTKPPLGLKVLMAPEFSTILKMKKEQVDLFLSNLRSTYDNRNYGASSGNIGAISYTNINFGFLGASTEVLDAFMRSNQNLGERVIIFRAGRQWAVYSVRLATVSDEREDREEKERARKELHSLTVAALDDTIEHMKTHKAGIVKPLQKQLGQLALVTADVRTCPLDNGHPASAPEGHKRLLHQFESYGDARVLFDNRPCWEESDVNACRLVAQDTVPPANLRLLRALWRRGPEDAVRNISRFELAAAAHVPIVMVLNQLHQWAIIDCVQQLDPNHFALKPHFVAGLEETDFLFNSVHGVDIGPPQAEGETQ